MANPHCSMVVQMPGWKGLANARVTIFGDVYPLPQEHQELAREIFRSTHSTKGNSHQWGNFMFFRMDNISDIYFVGGFGTVQWVDVEEYVRASPDAIVSRSSDVPVEQLLSVRAPHHSSSRITWRHQRRALHSVHSFPCPPLPSVLHVTSRAEKLPPRCPRAMDRGAESFSTCSFHSCRATLPADAD
jgi:hypothetical protein